MKTTKEYIEELQKLSDKHTSLKNEIESLLKEGENIKDKFKESARVFSITEAINILFKELESIEEQYDSLLKKYNDTK